MFDAFMVDCLNHATQFATTWWAPLVILFLMAVESSIFPVPSEAVMFPAGFFAARAMLFPAESPLLAAGLAIACGVVGSVIGAFFNYYCIALWLGRPFLHRWGKYFFLPPRKLERGEEIFREYGDVATFVCRLIPVARHLISIPAGISRMNIKRFAFFTATGAAVWVFILTALGYALGSRVSEMSNEMLVSESHRLARENLGWIVLGCAAVVAVYVWIHIKVMGKKKSDLARMNTDEHGSS